MPCHDATTTPTSYQRGRISLIAGLLTAAALLTGCATEEPKATARICDDQGCSDRDRHVTRYFSPDAPPFPADSDNWKGEPIAELISAASSGDEIAAYKAGVAYQEGYGGATRDPKLAALYLQQAADAGHAWAQFRLAQLYRDGIGVPKDQARSVQLVFNSAQTGLPQAAYNLGVLYANGDGVPHDDQTAARWLMRAAQASVPEAQFNLGLMYYRGTGVQRQVYDAIQWMRKAASNGNLAAQVALGRLYSTGVETMKPDLGEAKGWLSAAADRGDADAKQLLSKVLEQEAQNRNFDRQLDLAKAQSQTQSYWGTVPYASWLYPPVSPWVANQYTR